MEATNFVFYLAIFFLASYIAGGIINRKRMSSLSSTVVKHLVAAGADVKKRNTGPTAVVLAGKGPRPLLEYSVIVGIVSAANPITWLASRLAGRVDIMIIRSKLEETPRFEVTLVRKDTPAQKHIKRWGRSGEDAGEFIVVRGSESPSTAQVEELLHRIRERRGIVLFSVRKTLPHFQLYISLSGKGTELGEDLHTVSRALKALGKI